MKNCIFLQLLFSMLLLSAARGSAQVAETMDRQPGTVYQDRVTAGVDTATLSQKHFDTLSKTGATSGKSSLKAIRKNNLVLLEWVAAAGNNIIRFDVERSRDGTVFNKIGERDTISPKADGSFSFIDDRPQPIGYYRIKFITKEGSFTYSGETVINQITSFRVTIQPNPFVTSFSVDAFLPSAEPVKIQLLDMNGRLLRYKSIAGIAGNNKIEFDDLGTLQNGMYMVRIVKGNSVIEKKIIKGAQQ